MDSRKIMNGSFGEVWLDGELLASVFKFQAKVTFNKEEINLCGSLATDTKITSTKGTGTIGMYKVNSSVQQKAAQNIRAGKDNRFVIITKLADPDAAGQERIAVKNASFDDLTLADWEAKTPGKIECPFTFTDFEYLDIVEG